MDRKLHDDLVSAQAAQAVTQTSSGGGRRVALVIGNAAYTKPGSALFNPPNDARDVAAALGRLGFELIPSRADPKQTWHCDLDLNSFGSVLSNFSVACHGAEMAIVYYAGHGIEIEGTNYLIPVSAELDHIGALQWETTPLPSVLNALRGATRLKLLILDACRNNPFRTGMRGLEAGRFMGQGLANPNPPDNSLVFFAAAHGTTAKDGPRGGNSYFAQALIKHIETPDLEILHMFGEVTDDVRELTGHAQMPHHYGAKGRDLIYLKRSAPKPEAASAPDPGHSQLQHAALEWARLKDSSDVVRLKRLAQYFPGYYGDHALDRIAELERDAAERAKADAERQANEELTRRYSVDWSQALAADTVAGYAAFLAAWTGGPHEAAARAKLAAAEQRASAEQQRHRGRIQVSVGQRAKLVSLKPGESIRDLDAGPEMVLVAPGKFWMGSKDGEGGDNERPRHEVTIAKPLLVGKYPVTFAEFDYFKKHGGAMFSKLVFKESELPDDQGWGRGRRPVINVSWDDARAYVAWLSKATGKTYRLLSEAEWEYCCRAGTTTAYSVGDTITKQQAQFSEGKIGSAMQTVEVGTFAANTFGLHDMHGNVWERVEDAWHANYQGAPADGSVWQDGDKFLRVGRGGSWLDEIPRNLRSAYRGSSTTDNRSFNLGFRVARTL
jgi:formylglycine-generating enzyme required for sulfatase activity